MSLSLIRYKSARSNLTKSTNNIGDVVVPASLGFSDPTSSRVVLDMELNCTDANGDILLPCTFGQNSELVEGAHCLIRDVIITSSTQPVKVKRERRNYIDSNLKYFERSRSAEDCLATFGNSTNTNFGNDRQSKLPDNPWFDYQRPSDAVPDQSDYAVKRRAEIPIPLSFIDPMATISQFPNLAVGDLTYEYRFENLLDLVQPCDMPAGQIEPVDNRAFPPPDGGANTWGRTGNPIVLTKTVTNFWKPPVAGQLLNIYYVSGGTATNLTQQRIATVTRNGTDYELTLDTAINYAANITSAFCAYYTLPGQGFDEIYTCSAAPALAVAIGTTANPLVIPNVFSLNAPVAHSQCPFYVGAPITVLVSNTALNTQVLTEATVSHVRINGTSVELEVEGLGIPVTASASNIPRVGYRFSTNNVKFAVNWVVDFLYMEMARINMTPNQIQVARSAMADLEIPFMIQSMISYTMAESQDLLDWTITLEPGTVGVAVLTPPNAGLVSGRDTVSSYLFTIDNQPYTNQQIAIGDEDQVDRSIHNYLLKRGLSNVGIDFARYEANRLSLAARDPRNDHTIYAVVVNQLGVPQTLKTFFRSDSVMEAKTIYFVKFRPAVLKFGGGRAMIVS